MSNTCASSRALAWRLCVAFVAVQAAATLACDTWDLSFDVVAGPGSPAQYGFSVTITNGLAVSLPTVVPGPLPIQNNYHVALPAISILEENPLITTMTFTKLPVDVGSSEATPESLLNEAIYLQNIRLNGCVNYTTDGVPVSIGIGLIYPPVPVVQVVALLAVETPCLQPPVATLGSAVFSPDAAGIMMDFTGPTDAANQTGYFPCQEVIEDADTTLEENAQCIFLNPSQLWIQLTSAVKTRPGTTLTLKSGVIGILETLLCPLDTLNYIVGSVVVDVLSAALSPVLNIAGAERIQPCADLVVYAAPHAARILQYSWTLLSPTPHDASVDSILASSTSSLRIPAELLVGGQYEVGLQVSDIFDVQSSIVTMMIERLSSPAFEAKILGQRVRTVFKSQMVDVFAAVTFPSCLPSNTPMNYTKITMTWLQETSPNEFSPVHSLSTMPRRLLLRASDLPVGVTQHYRMNAVSIDQPSMDSFADVWITVDPSPLVVRIIGGERVVGKMGALPIQSGSYDPDDPGSSLEHSWQCHATSDNSACGAFSSTSSKTWLFEPSTVTANPLPEGRYNITLSVTASDGRTGTAKIGLVVVDQPTFDVQILVNSTAFNTYGVVNPDEDLRFAAVMTLAMGDSISHAMWSSSLGQGGDFPHKSASLNCPFLVVDPMVLIPRRSYTFTFVAAASPGGLQGAASITVPINAPPSPGSCSIEPSSGVAAETPFLLFCSDWVDEQLPLQYEFEVEGEIGVVPLVRRSGNSMIQVVLPSLTAACAPTQQVLVHFRVFDSLGASSNVTKTVTLTNTCSTASTHFTTTMNVAGTFEDDGEKVLSNALFAAIEGEVEDMSTTLDLLQSTQELLDLDDSSLLQQGAMLATYLLANESTRDEASSEVLALLQEVIVSSSVCTTAQQIDLTALTMNSLAVLANGHGDHDDAIMASLADISRLHAGQYLVPGAAPMTFLSGALSLQTVEYDSCVLAATTALLDENSTIEFSFDTASRFEVSTSLLVSLNGEQNCAEQFDGDSTDIPTISSTFVQFADGAYQHTANAINTSIALSVSACGNEIVVQDLQSGQMIGLQFSDPAIKDWLFIDSISPDDSLELDTEQLPEHLHAPFQFHTCTSDAPELANCANSSTQQMELNCSQPGEVFEFQCAVAVSVLTCEYFNETTDAWDTFGCNPISSFNGTAWCECNHLTAFTAKGRQMFSRTAQTVAYTPQLQVADVAQNPGVVSMLVAMFGLYIVGFATAARNDQRKQRNRMRALWRTDKIQKLTSLLVTSELFADQRIVYNDLKEEVQGASPNYLSPQCDDVEQKNLKIGHTAQTPSPCYSVDVHPKGNCLRILQAETAPRSICQEWCEGLRVNHRLFSLFVPDNLSFLTQKQKMTLAFCQALTMLLLATLVYDGSYKFDDWYAQLTNEDDDNEDTIHALVDALWICSVTVAFALPLTVILFHLFVAASQEQKARYQYETKLRDEGSYLITSGRATTLAELRCLVFEIETLYTIAEAEYHAMLLDDDLEDDKRAADCHRASILDPLQQRLETATRCLHEAEHQLDAKIAAAIATRTEGKDFFAAWDEAMRARQEIKQVIQQEELKASIGSLTIPQKVAYWHDQLVLAKIPRYSCWRPAYWWFLVHTDGYVPKGVHQFILATVTFFTLVFIVLSSAYILVYGLSEGEDTIRRAIASFFLQSLLDILIFTPLLILVMDVFVPRFVRKRLRHEIREADLTLARVEVEDLLQVGSVEELDTNKPRSQSMTCSQSSNGMRRRSSDAVELVRVRPLSTTR